MKAIRIHKTGGPEVLKYEDVNDPVCQSDEVIVQVKSISINFSDVLIRRGEYPYMPDLPAILGAECSGIVSEVGTNVSHLKSGQPVVVFGQPSYCEKICVKAKQVIPLPEGSDMDKAAALPIVYLTAYHMLKTVRRVQKGESVLIYSAAGSVGIAAIQLCKHLGLKSIGLTSKDHKADLIKGIGIDHVINYKTEDVVNKVLEYTDGKGVDLILESVAGPRFGENFKMLNTLGQVIWFGIADGNPTTDLLRAIARDPSKSYGVSMFHLFSIIRNPALFAASMQELIGYLVKGIIDPVIHEVFDLKDAGMAHQVLENHENIGKVILRA